MCVWPAMVDNIYCFPMPNASNVLVIDLNSTTTATTATTTAAAPGDQPSFTVRLFNITLPNPVSPGTDVTLQILGGLSAGLSQSQLLSLSADPTDHKNVAKLPDVPADGKNCGIENAVIMYTDKQIKFVSGKLIPPQNGSTSTQKNSLVGDILLHWEPQPASENL